MLHPCIACQQLSCLWIMNKTFWQPIPKTHNKGTLSLTNINIWIHARKTASAHCNTFKRTLELIMELILTLEYYIIDFATVNSNYYSVQTDWTLPACWPLIHSTHYTTYLFASLFQANKPRQQLDEGETDHTELKIFLFWFLLYNKNHTNILSSES